MVEEFFKEIERREQQKDPVVFSRTQIRYKDPRATFLTKLNPNLSIEEREKTLGSTR